MMRTLATSTGRRWRTDVGLERTGSLLSLCRIIAGQPDTILATGKTHLSCQSINQSINQSIVTVCFRPKQYFVSFQFYYLLFCIFLQAYGIFLDFIFCNIYTQTGYYKICAINVVLGYNFLTYTITWCCKNRSTFDRIISKNKKGELFETRVYTPCLRKQCANLFYVLYWSM